MKTSFLALLSVVPFFTSLTVVAQDRSPSVSKNRVAVFKGNGLDRVPRGKKPPPPPPPRGLGPSAFMDIAAILGKVESGSTYLTLSPSFPAVNNKGVLLFWNADLVETGENYAFWGEEKYYFGAWGSVDLWIWSPASHLYMIDCTVSGYQYGMAPKTNFGRRGPSFDVIGPDGVAQLFDFSDNVVTGPESWSAFDLFKSSNAEAHLAFALIVGTKGWYGFQIVPKAMVKEWGAGPNLAQWAFFSCKVLNATANVPGHMSPQKKPSSR